MSHGKQTSSIPEGLPSLWLWPAPYVLGSYHKSLCDEEYPPLEVWDAGSRGDVETWVC